MHVSYISYPKYLSDVYSLMLTPEQYRQLTKYILSSLKFTEDGGLSWIPGSAYGSRDAFYEAQGNYTLITTCNHWTGRALEATGVKTGIWTPFSFNVTTHLQEGSKR